MEDSQYNVAGATDPITGHGRPIRRRNRMINSCLECRKRKLKCSKTSPTCTNCSKAGRDCLYIGPRLDIASQLRLTEIKEKQGTLERELERDVAKSTTAKSGDPAHRTLADEVDDRHDEDRDLEATPLVALDLTYEDDADSTDNMIDLGIQIGKMRITERIGGLSRPRIAEELATGISGWHSSQCSPQPPQSSLQTKDYGTDAEIPDFLRPGSEYLVPTSGFYFTQLPTIRDEAAPITELLPHRVGADRLMKQYFTAVHAIAPCTHRPSLEVAYTLFWAEVDMGYEPRPSTQALIFAALFSAVVSMDEGAAYNELGNTKKQWIASLKLGTESALSKANFLRTTRVETLQAFVMYMLPLCRAEVSRAHSVLVASAVRAAECMGLHRDGQAYGLSPVDTHVRRLIWHQLCFLDIRTCEAQGPRPVIRREEYDTKLPLNCNETELTNVEPGPANADHWTTNTIALIRFEINEMMRSIWVDRRRLETRKTTLTAVLTKVEHFRRKMSEKYDHMLDMEDPLQRYTRVVMHLLTYRLHVMVLHPYHSNAASAMPRKLSHLLITSGVLIAELAIQLETNHNFGAWKWYLGAYFQYQIALLLATEVYFNPRSREAGRIWFCLDYVFGLDPRLAPETKCIRLLGEISDKTNVYMHIRKMRGPNEVSRAVPAHHVVSGTAKEQPRRQHQDQLAGFSFNEPLAPRASQSINQNPMSYTGSRPEQNSRYSSVPVQAQLIASQPTIPLTHQLQQQPQMVFAGVCDGQALWSLPPNPNNSSPSSDTASAPANEAITGAVPQDSIMDTIDWDAMSGLFPVDPQTGAYSAQGFIDPNFGILCGWQQD
ncbi:uncharacterized protein B0I36DRAFT_429282 [Microdochium trichocladiopsis]|uniref:Zn(2)-C6 fungal-type domain-containing protein n=1 Tax=Microdochium trichocladiopsis TaxID=1682393 RepID=A0A9P9BSY6_9PEZI|nr:uncharacterized protein B0I36DRAFT_429282 [Microdochium trichocladiopsis]KAH7035069.1 hypothetical protein B0I36DRAFT_429282 [Microdochium trichocladiopsis]